MNAIYCPECNCPYLPGYMADDCPHDRLPDVGLTDCEFQRIVAGKPGICPQEVVLLGEPTA